MMARFRAKAESGVTQAESGTDHAPDGIAAHDGPVGTAPNGAALQEADAARRAAGAAKRAAEATAGAANGTKAVRPAASNGPALAAAARASRWQAAFRAERLALAATRRAFTQLAIIATLVLTFAVLAVLALLPLTLANIVDDFAGTGESEIYTLSYAPARGVGAAPSPAAERLALDLTVVDLDQNTRRISIQVSGHRTCADGCSTAEALVLYSLPPPGGERAGLPPSVTVTIPARQVQINQTVDLPVVGHAVRYPFDSFSLRMAFALERAGSDGTMTIVPRQEASEGLVLTIQEHLSRLEMSAPETIDVDALRLPRGIEYLGGVHIEFRRLPYLQVLAVLLVALIAVAAAVTAARRTLPEFFVNFGGTVIGIWGVRSILVPSNIATVTSVDLALSVILLLLLGSVLVRVLWIVHHHSGLPPRRWHTRPDPPDA